MTVGKHLHFTQSLEPLQGGGLGSSAVALHAQLLSQGIGSVLCATHGGAPQSPADAVREYRRWGPNFVYFAPGMRRDCVSLVRQADLIHGHGLYVGSNYLFGRESRRQRKPLIYHVQGMFEPYILRRSRWKKRLVHWLFENENTRRVRLWRALTDKEADQIRACGFAAPIVVAPNGLNLTDFQPPPISPTVISTPWIPELTKERRRLLFLGRIHPKKGLDLLLTAWSRLARERRDWELVVAGPDEQGYLEKVRALSRECGVEREVRYTGTVTGKEKVALLYSADLFVLASYSEGLPVSLLEAMACEVPVVASIQCNCPEVETGEAGWMCDAAGIDSVVSALRAGLTASEQERRQRGRRARQLVASSYSWPRITDTILQACVHHC